MLDLAVTSEKRLALSLRKPTETARIPEAQRKVGPLSRREPRLKRPSRRRTRKHFLLSPHPFVDA
jgi:hypothetical protein